MKLILALFAIALLLAVLSRVRRSRNRAIATARVVPMGILIFAGVLLGWGAATVGIERIFGISSDSAWDLYLNLFGWSFALVLSFTWMICDYRRTTSVEQPDEPNADTMAVLLLSSGYGVYLIWKAVTNDIYDWVGESFAPRWMYIAGGLLLQLPLIIVAILFSGLPKH